MQLLVVVIRDHAAQRNTPKITHIPECCLEYLPADVFEIDVDALGTNLSHTPRQRFAAAIVEGGVKPKLVGQKSNLVIGTGTPCNATTVNFRELTDDTADGPRSCGHEHIIFSLHVCNLV